MVLPPAGTTNGSKRAGDRTQAAWGRGPLLDAAGLKQVRRNVLEPTLTALRARGIDYRGVIYAGLMLTMTGRG